MLLFKPQHVPLILSGRKTMTMRQWERSRVKVGSIHQCRTQLFKGEPFAHVCIVSVYRQRLGEMTADQYKKEGGYARESYIKVWKEINGSYDPNELACAVEFDLAEDAAMKRT
jgi:hypothetical protein